MNNDKTNVIYKITTDEQSQKRSDTKRKRKKTKQNKRKSNKRTKSTEISSLFPKRVIAMLKDLNKKKKKKTREQNNTSNT